MNAPGWRGVVEEFRARLPLPSGAPAVTLLEGNTPLVPARHAGRGVRLFFKCEGANPTGSFKDRGMSVAVTGAAAAGARAVICASTGNTAASAAAYAARAGLPAILVLPAGYVAAGKMAQAVAAGARLLAVQGNFDAALEIVRRVAAERPEIALVNSVNPLRLEGQKTGAFEVVDVLGEAPDWLAIPVGNAGNISAYWRGFCEEVAVGRAQRRPRLLGVQAAGAAPLVGGAPVDRPETVATAIRIGRPASAELARTAVREADGRFLAVPDAAILEAYRFLARQEGIFAEPASAASLAGLWVAIEQGLIRPDETVACVLTGHGLKDPDRAVAEAEPPRPVEPTAAAVSGAVDDVLG